MDDSSQILVPDSFVALYQPSPHRRPSLPRAELAARHELCEDLATLLTEQCRTLQFREDLPEDVVLRRCLQGLRATPETVSADEAWWVVRRAAELLDWSWEGVEPPAAG